MISSALVLSIEKASCASSKEVTRVPVIHVETADHVEKAQTASASFVCVGQATEEITVKLLPIPVDQILVCTEACVWGRNLGLFICLFD